MGPQPTHTSKAIYEAKEDSMFKLRLQKTLVPEKTLLMNRKQQKFIDEQKKQEDSKKQLELEEKAKLAAEKERRRSANLDKLRRNAGFMEEWEINGQKEWQKNIAKKFERERKEIEFEKKNLLKLTALAQTSKENNRKLFEKEIDEFETDAVKNTIALDAEPQQENAKEEINPMEPEETIPLKATTLSPMKKVISDQEKKERDRRRRKMIVDLGKSQAEEEAQRREDDITARLKKMSKQEKELLYEEWRTQQCKNIITENRSLRDNRYQKRVELDSAIAAIREKEASEQLITKKNQTLDFELQRMHEISISLKQRIRKNLGDQCHNMVNSIIDIAEYAFASLQNQDAKELNTVNLNDWMHLFINNAPASAATSIKEEESSAILNDKEFMDYLRCKNMWNIEVKAPNTSNVMETVAIPETHTILGDAIKTIIDINFGASPPPELAKYPFYLPIKLSIIGKQFSGKKSLVEYIKNKYNIEVIDVLSLINEELATESDLKNIIKNSLLQGNEISDEISALLIKQKILKLFPYKTEQQIMAEFEEQIRNNKALTETITTEKNAEEAKPQANEKIKEEKKDIIIEVKEPLKPVQTETLQIWRPAGFVLHGFPTNINQAMILEELLTNFKDSKLQKPTEKEILMKQATILYPPSKIEEKQMELQQSAFDSVICLNALSDNIMQRCYGTLYDPNTKNFYHLDSNQPPVNQNDLCERLQLYKNSNLDEYVITDKIAAFDIAINTLLKWYEQFGRKQDGMKAFCVVEANDSIKKVCNNVDEQIQKILSLKIQQRKETEELIKRKIEEEKQLKIKQEEERKKKEEEERIKKEEEEKKRKQKENEDELEDIDENKDKKLEVPKEEPTAEAKEEDDTKKEEQTKQQEPVVAAKPAEPLKIILEIEQQFKSVLLKEWLSLYSSYTTTTKKTMGFLRKNRELFTQQMKEMQIKFIKHLLLPDSKQQKIDQFILNYNAFITEHPDMIEKVEVKQEMHQRTEDLLDSIYECIEQRKKDASTKRDSFMQSGLMEYFLKLFIADLASLLQSEADKYLRVRQLIKDYYNALEKHELHDLPSANTKFEVDESLALLENNTSPRFNDIAAKALNFVEPIAEPPVEKDAPKGKKEAPKKDKKALNVPVEPEVVSESQKCMAERLTVEEKGYKYRIMLIKSFGEQEIQRISKYCSFVFSKLISWIHVQYNVETSTAKSLENIVRGYIEKESKISHELLIVNHDLYVNKQYAYYITPPPKPWPAREKVNEMAFSISQMKNICNLIRINSEAAEISFHAIISIFNAMRNQTSTYESYLGLPTKWLTINSTMLNDILHKLDINSVGTISYKAIINIICLQNSRIPTESDIQDLRSKALNTTKDGKLDKTAFTTISFWFDNEEACDTRPNSEEFYRFNKIKEILFSNFCSQQNFVDIEEYITIASMKDYHLTEKNYREIIFKPNN